jgi:hypothetical protein
MPQDTFQRELNQTADKVEKGWWQVNCLHGREKNIYNKSIGRASTDKEGLNMVVIVRNHTGKHIRPTFFSRGSALIDGVWATVDINITHACIMPATYEVRDHRLFVVDFQEESLIITSLFSIKQFTSRRLKNPKVSNAATRNYIARLEDNLGWHR